MMPAVFLPLIHILAYLLQFVLCPPYVHALYWFILPLCVVMSQQPVCNENLRARFVYDLDPVLVNF